MRRRGRRQASISACSSPAFILEITAQVIVFWIAYLPG
jgi:hypothetical protein